MIEISDEPITLEVSRRAFTFPPIFGRCPECDKELNPRDRYGNPKAPSIGAGAESRAECMGCGSIIEYIGSGNWVLVDVANLPESELEPE